MKKPVPPDSCPCCGYTYETDLDREVCPACFHLPEEVDPAPRREEWIAAGMPWRSTRKPKPPKKWDALQNLASLARHATIKRVKGRPPRLN